MSVFDGKDVRVPEFSDGMEGTELIVDQRCGSEREMWCTKANKWGHSISGYNSKLIGVKGAPTENATLCLQTALKIENAFVFEEHDEWFLHHYSPTHWILALSSMKNELISILRHYPYFGRCGEATLKREASLDEVKYIRDALKGLTKAASFEWDFRKRMNRGCLKRRFDCSLLSFQTWAASMIASVSLLKVMFKSQNLLKSPRKLKPFSYKRLIVHDSNLFFRKDNASVRQFSKTVESWTKRPNLSTISIMLKECTNRMRDLLQSNILWTILDWELVRDSDRKAKWRSNDESMMGWERRRQNLESI